VIHRGEAAFVLLNKFPYATGHLMVAPYRHGTAFDTLDEAEAAETHRLAVEGIEALRTVFSPEGFNVGWNLGRVAGAGIVDHAHVHVVPRWNGDTNFMPLLADTHVPDEAYQAVAAEFSPQQVAALVSLIVTINAWNAIGVSTRAWAPGSYSP